MLTQNSSNAESKCFIFIYGDLIRCKARKLQTAITPEIIHFIKLMQKVPCKKQGTASNCLYEK